MSIWCLTEKGINTLLIMCHGWIQNTVIFSIIENINILKQHVGLDCLFKGEKLSDFFNFCLSNEKNNKYFIERINSIPGSPQPVTTVRQRTFSDSSQKSGFQKPGFHQQASVMSATNDKEEMKKAGEVIINIVLIQRSISRSLAGNACLISVISNSSLLFLVDYLPSNYMLKPNVNHWIKWPDQNINISSSSLCLLIPVFLQRWFQPIKNCHKLLLLNCTQLLIEMLKITN